MLMMLPEGITGETWFRNARMGFWAKGSAGAVLSEQTDLGKFDFAAGF